MGHRQLIHTLLCLASPFSIGRRFYAKRSRKTNPILVLQRGRRERVERVERVERPCPAERTNEWKEPAKCVRKVRHHPQESRGSWRYCVVCSNGAIFLALAAALQP